MNNIEQYSDLKGRGVVSEYIQVLFKGGRADHAKKILKTLERLETNNLELLLRIRLVKKIKGKNNIFELVINWKNANYRIFFSIINKSLYLTSIFYKKKQKTPVNEIEMAEKRKKEIELNF